MKTINPHTNFSQARAFLGLLKESIIGSLRNPTTIFFSFLFPFIFISIFGILDYGDIKIPVAVTQQSLKSGVLYEALTKVTALDLVTTKSDEQINDDLNKGRLAAAITITENGVFSPAPTVSLTQYAVQIQQSAADPNNANSVYSIISSVSDSINLSATANTPKLVSLSTTLVEGRKFQQIDFILPGQLAFALLTGALFGISIKFINYKKELILKRYFASPIKKPTIMAAEIVSKVFIAILQTLVIVLVGHFLFSFTLAQGVATVGNMVLLSLVGTFTFLGFGLLIPSIAKNEDAVGPVSNIIMMPQLFLSGAFFPLEAFPKFIQNIAHILPMTYLNEAFKTVAFEGLNLSAVTPQIVGLLVWGILLYALNIFLFKWE